MFILNFVWFFFFFFSLKLTQCQVCFGLSIFYLKSLTNVFFMIKIKIKEEQQKQLSKAKATQKKYYSKQLNIHTNVHPRSFLFRWRNLSEIFLKKHHHKNTKKLKFLNSKKKIRKILIIVMDALLHIPLANVCSAITMTHEKTPRQRIDRISQIYAIVFYVIYFEFEIMKSLTKTKLKVNLF